MLTRRRLALQTTILPVLLATCLTNVHLRSYLIPSIRSLRIIFTCLPHVLPDLLQYQVNIGPRGILQLGNGTVKLMLQAYLQRMVVCILTLFDVPPLLVLVLVIVVLHEGCPTCTFLQHLSAAV